MISLSADGPRAAAAVIESQIARTGKSFRRRFGRWEPDRIYRLIKKHW
jgi:hypothetical protein